MRLLALVPCRLLQPLHEALGDGNFLHGIVHPESAVAKLATGESWDVVVIDPDLCNVGEREHIIRRAQMGGSAVVLYSVLNRSGAVAALVEGVSAVVLRGYDDRVTGWREVLERLPVRPLEFRLLQRLARRFDALPSALRRNIVATFSSTYRVHSTKQLVEKSGTSRRSLDRWMKWIGVRSATWLVASVRLARAYPSLENPCLSLRDIASQHGYGSVRSLNSQTRALTGFGPRLLPQRLADDQFLERLEASLLGSRKDTYRQFLTKSPGAACHLVGA